MTEKTYGIPQITDKELENIDDRHKFWSIRTDRVLYEVYRTAWYCCNHMEEEPTKTNIADAFYERIGDKDFCDVSSRYAIISRVEELADRGYLNIETDIVSNETSVSIERDLFSEPSPWNNKQKNFIVLLGTLYCISIPYDLYNGTPFSLVISLSIFSAVVMKFLESLA
ncbi:MAG: hypothetical protein ABEI78_02490, partial [Candidatus Nanohaloarchaea archaeon]